ncbi:hypothetical protein [Cylindrospermopsis raciborskii]|uniref:hypothetical protein n=1 Tax=Cylindrospermopsis raciborskii TaxID=77022 RepID=UPI001F34DAF9|nr:hypothetical protein [Cylindrospermopsis raciborskii]
MESQFGQFILISSSRRSPAKNSSPYYTSSRAGATPPDEISLEVSIRENNSFREVEDFATWTSPRLNIRFDMTGDELVIYYPDGSRFLSPVELSNYAEQERFLKEQANERAEQERFLKEQERLLKEQEQLKYQTLLSQLKAKGIDINALE